jgi:hypothetical protein
VNFGSHPLLLLGSTAELRGFRSGWVIGCHGSLPDLCDVIFPIHKSTAVRMLLSTTKNAERHVHRHDPVGLINDLADVKVSGDAADDVGVAAIEPELGD